MKIEITSLKVEELKSKLWNKCYAPGSKRIRFPATSKTTMLRQQLACKKMMFLELVSRIFDCIPQNNIGEDNIAEKFPPT